MKKNQKTIWAIIIVVVVALVIFFISRDKGSVNIETPVTENTQTTETTNGVTGQTTSKNKTITPVSSTSYENALAQYRDRRIQLGTDCQATPSNVTYKNGTSIMVDNRSTETRTVRVGSNYTIAPWSFKIINLTSSTIPATWLVDCGAQQNVATILIQK